LPVEDDPVKFGLAASLDKPGGNATGIYFADTAGSAFDNTRKEILRQLVPNRGGSFWTLQILDAHSNATLTDPEARLADMLKNTRANTAPFPEDLRPLLKTDPAAALRQWYERTGPATNPATVSMVWSLEIDSGPFIDGDRLRRAVALVARHTIPALSHWRAFVEAGGLMSYGLDIEDGYAQLGRYAAEILKGGNPAEMPVVKPTKTETVINLRAAAGLGLPQHTASGAGTGRQGDPMKCREFIALMGGAAACPLAARAQLAPLERTSRPVIGFLNNMSPDAWQPAMTGFRQGLSEIGFAEGHNVAFEYR
jgi:hypothetical protein